MIARVIEWSVRRRGLVAMAALVLCDHALRQRAITMQPTA